MASIQFLFQKIDSMRISAHNQKRQASCNHKCRNPLSRHPGTIPNSATPRNDHPEFSHASEGPSRIQPCLGTTPPFQSCTAKTDELSIRLLRHCQKIGEPPSKASHPNDIPIQHHHLIESRWRGLQLLRWYSVTLSYVIVHNGKPSTILAW
jgi:hypothetical protein